MKKILIAYVPVLHKGYIDLFNKHRDAECLYLLGDDHLRLLDYIVQKDIRRITANLMQQVLVGLDLFDTVSILRQEDIGDILTGRLQVVMPDDDISRLVAEVFFPSVYVEYVSVFLRWNKKNVQSEEFVTPDSYILPSDFNTQVMGLAYAEAAKSSDWWRQVGAVIVRNGEILLIGYNQHVPSAQEPYVVGDPRSLFKKGIHIELSTAIHAESLLIAIAAKSGIYLQRSDMYVTTFPCPPCAKLIAHSGIRRLFYSEGYALLDGETILKQSGVEIINVHV